MGKGGQFGIIALALGGCDAPSAPPPPAPQAPQPATLDSAPDSYRNAKHGFAIAIPEGWIEVTAATGPDGAIFRRSGFDAELRLSAAPGTVGNAAQALRAGKTGVTGAPDRGSALDSFDSRWRWRLLRTRDGAVVTAAFRYPSLRREFDPVAEGALDTLVLL